MGWSSTFCSHFLLICFIIQHAVSDEAKHVFDLCPDMSTVAPDSIFQLNVNTLLSYLESNTTNENRFYNTTVGSGANKVYGAFFCRIDQTILFCKECISSAIKSSKDRCPGKKATIVWYDQCLVRHSNKSFIGTMDASPMIPMWNRNPIDRQEITSNLTGFAEVLHQTLRNVSFQAANGSPERKFSTEEGEIVANLTRKNMIYTLAECSPDISVRDCITCLEMTIGNMTEQCNLMAGCTMMCPNCNMRYDVNPFYGEALLSSPGPEPAPAPTPAPEPAPLPTFGESSREVATESNRQMVLIIIGISVSAALALVIFIGARIFMCKRLPKKVIDETLEVDHVFESSESLKFDVNTIKKATHNFSAENKLGEGGFGEVYKGKLENGQNIAIKRLSSSSEQGIHEFKTEVVLVAKLQHRNLVKLLGFCLSRKEKILVYEFLHNMSLDKFLSDPTKRVSLNWSTRFKIIGGVARGLLYLHEDSRLKIVHRDLKPSNILLDEAMNPKIADFGIAKLFGVDQTQDNTNRIVGTFGYMAPEYFMTGHYSVKSDIYSFGIIVLELVSGLRNRYFRQQLNDESLLHKAWRYWNERMPLKLADSTFGDIFSAEEMEICIHIGLLCVQEDAAKRPRMASLVAALNGESITLPSPTSSSALYMTNYSDDGPIKSGSVDGGCRSAVMQDITVLSPR